MTMTIDIQKEYRLLENAIAQALEKAAFIGNEMGGKTKNYPTIVDLYDDLSEAMTKLHVAMDV